MGYNPLAAVRVGRLEDISAELRGQDIVALVGTQCRARRGCTSEPIRLGLPEHHEYRFPWSPGPFVNKSCGGSILLKKTRFPKPNIAAVLKPTTGLVGRVGGLVIRGDVQLAAFFIYWPPRPVDARSGVVYERTRSAIFEWVLSRVLPWRGRALLVGAMDLNDDFGVPDRNAMLSRAEMSVAPAEGGAVEHCAATYCRRMCAALDAIVPSASATNGPTFWGMRGGSSRIDHLLVSREAVGSVERCRVMQASGTRLQAVAARRRVDHFPVQMVLRFDLRPWSLAPVEHVWDKPALNECLLRGWRRKEVVQAVEKGIGEKSANIDEMVRWDGAPDGLHQLIVSTVEAAAAPVLKKEKEARQGGDAAEVRRLLEGRRQLRVHMHEAESWDEEWELSVEITRLSRRLKKAKQRRLDEEDEAIVEEMWRARKERRGKEVWQLARRLSRTGMGKQGRSLRIVAAKVDPAQWVSRLREEGRKGGVSATSAEVDETVPRLIEASPPSESDYEGARQDLKLMREGAWRMKTWKAGVTWSVPVEMLRILLFPNWQYIRDARLGVGCVEERIAAPKFTRLLVHMLAKVRATQRTPVQWHLARACFIPKYNGRLGCDAERLIVIVCCIGALFYRALLTRATGARQMIRCRAGRMEVCRREGGRPPC